MGVSIFKLLGISLLLQAVLSIPVSAGEQHHKFDDIPDHLFAGNTAPLGYPDAPPQTTGALIPPPSENSYYAVRWDDQPLYLMQDITVNYTDVLNSFYLDPFWRGEDWAPFEQFSILEKAQRAMSSWREYDEFSWFKVCNRWHKFWERTSGFGP